MKFYQIIVFLSFVILSLASCEEVIELDLKNDEPKLVIEAKVDANTQIATVLLTMSNGFYDAITLELVNNATIQITESDGTIKDLPLISDGLYMTNNIQLADGDELSIAVIDGNGKEYNAKASVPHIVSIDSLSVMPSPRPGQSSAEPISEIFTYWQDAANVESFYRVRALRNDTLLQSYRLIDDFGLDGEQLFQPSFDTFIAGDTATIQVLSIDEVSYRYFSDLAAVQGGGPGGSTTPFNPKTNFDNNALGYFGIFRMDVETVIVE
jgi:hypothetical protein